LAHCRERADILGGQLNSPQLWHDHLLAREIEQQYKREIEIVASFQSLCDRVEELLRSAKTIEPDSDVPSAEWDAELVRLGEGCRELEIILLFRGEKDFRKAVLTVEANVNGESNRRWAEQLFKGYLRWALRNHHPAQIVEGLPTQPVPAHRFSAIISGANAFGWLRSEDGVHRSFTRDSSGGREVANAHVHVVPEISRKQDLSFDVSDLDIRMDTMRCVPDQGPYAGRTFTIRQLAHIPTGITITHPHGSLFHETHVLALRVLKSRLFALLGQSPLLVGGTGRHYRDRIEWGNPIRIYDFRPPNIVKDIRTGYKSSNPPEVVDGNFDGFMTAYLEMMAGTEDPRN